MNTKLASQTQMLMLLSIAQNIGASIEGFGTQLSQIEFRGMLNLGFVMGFVGVAVGLMIAMFIFGAIDNAIVCGDIISTTGQTNCNLVKSTSWTVLGILPITLFFVLFSIFGGFGRE